MIASKCTCGTPVLEENTSELTPEPVLDKEGPGTREPVEERSGTDDNPEPDTETVPKPEADADAETNVMLGKADAGLGS